ncbi:MAG: hypothetical protein GVY20_09725 [Bacteroidetes bacterium]|jgi:hypothetical protein|nr:hypothetical protein [Bacteroidota bacterium]
MNEEDKYRSKKYSTVMNSKYGNKAGKVVRILIREIDSIRYVKQWAKEANVAQSWLKKEMKTTYDKPPKIILREVRFEIIVFLIIKNGAEVTSLIVALESGVGETSDALYKFLKRHYNTTFSDLKEFLLTEEPDICFSWLNWKELFSFYEYLNWRQ